MEIVDSVIRKMINFMRLQET